MSDVACLMACQLLVYFVALVGAYLQVRTFIDGAYQRTVALLREKKELVENMAQVGCHVFWVDNWLMNDDCHDFVVGSHLHVA